MNIRQLLTSALIALFLTGCVSTRTVTLDQSTSANLSGKTMVVATSDKPDFAAQTAGKAMFAVLGAVAMISAGNKIIRENNVQDPAVFIGEEVAKELSTSRSIEVVSPPAPSEEDSLSSLLSTHANRDYVLDVRTINWSFGYFPTDWNNYRVMYSAKSRLIDVNAKKVVAEAFCARVPEKSADAPSYNDLLSNNAARLKKELQIAAEQCVSEFKSKLL